MCNREDRKSGYSSLTDIGETAQVESSTRLAVRRPGFVAVDSVVAATECVDYEVERVV